MDEELKEYLVRIATDIGELRHNEIRLFINNQTEALSTLNTKMDEIIRKLTEIENEIHRAQR